MIGLLQSIRLLLALLATALPVFASAEMALMHVHGLSYSADGKQLMIPSHHGLAIYRGGKWSRAAGPQHDYMGFSATARHLYSSGHPAPGSGLVNPFGLIRSRDGGRTWDKLGLEGETDFHLLATGWDTNAIYVWNPSPNSRMANAGLHYTLNDGMVWKSGRAAGLDGDPRALAVHPDDPRTVAVATSKGLYASRNAGESFQKTAAGEATSVFFDLDGKHLWYGSFDGRARLARVPIGEASSMQIGLPLLQRDAVAYIAQNPSNRDEYAISTFMRNVYLTKDAGRSWVQIADQGQAK